MATFIAVRPAAQRLQLGGLHSNAALHGGRICAPLLAVGGGGGTARPRLPPPPKAQQQQEDPALAIMEAVDAAESDAILAGRAVAAATNSRWSQPIWRWEESRDAVTAYGLFFGILGAGLIPGLQENKFTDLPYFLGLAYATIYIGAHRGLNARQRQQISLKEGLLAPVAASASLFGLYLLLKNFPDLSIQALLNAYFWLLGSVALVGALGPTLRTLGTGLGQPVWRFQLPVWAQVEDERGEAVTEGDLTPTDILSAVAAVALATLDAQANHGNFTLNNLIACAVATDLLGLVGLKSFCVAAVLLLGLLAYDVFWVFGSPSVVGENVMLQVATSDVITGPVRLLFPRIPGSIGEAAEFPFSLLGLGDVAIPGLLACLALRYDASRVVDLRARGVAVATALQDALGSMDKTATRKEMGEVAVSAAESAYDLVAEMEEEQKARTQGQGASTETVYLASDAVLCQRPYFTAVMRAYLLGLAMAFGVNAVTHLGQPALLYLCPLTLGAVGVTAARRGDLALIWNYADTTASPAPAKGKAEQQGGDAQ